MFKAAVALAVPLVVEALIAHHGGQMVLGSRLRFNSRRPDRTSTWARVRPYLSQRPQCDQICGIIGDLRKGRKGEPTCPGPRIVLLCMLPVLQSRHCCRWNKENYFLDIQKQDFSRVQKNLRSLWDHRKVSHMFAGITDFFLVKTNIIIALIFKLWDGMKASGRGPEVLFIWHLFLQR